MNSDGGQPQLENAPSAPELAPALVQAQNTHIGTDSAQDEHNDLDHNADASKRPLTLFEKAKQHQERRKIFQTLIHEQCTFQPSINRRSAVLASSKARRASEGSAPGEENAPTAPMRLFAEAQKRKERQEQRANGLADPECTFHPAVTEKALRMKSKDPQQHAAAMDHLYNRAHTIQLKKEAALQKAMQEAYEQATSPKLSRGTVAMVSRPSSAASRPATERLYDPGWVRRRQAPEANQADLGLKIDEECTFKPKINKGLPNAVRAHFEAMEVGQQIVSPSRGGGGWEGGVSHRQAQERDSKDANGMRRASAAHERLYSAAARKRNDIAAMAVEVDALSLKDCTFKPDTAASRRSAKAIGVQHVYEAREAAAAGTAEVQEGEVPSTTYDRLYSAAKERQQRHALAADEQRAVDAIDPECTFEPAISNTSRKIVEHKHRASLPLVPETVDASTGPHAPVPGIPRHLSLYEEGRVHLKARQMAAENPLAGLTAEDLRELTFAPRISHARGVLGGHGRGTVQQAHEAGGSAVPIHDRLFQQAKDKQAAAAAALLAQATSAALPAIHPVTVRAPARPATAPVRNNDKGQAGAAADAARHKGADKQAKTVKAAVPVTLKYADVEGKLRTSSLLAVGGGGTGGGSPGTPPEKGQTMPLSEAKSRTVKTAKKDASVTSTSPREAAPASPVDGSSSSSPAISGAGAPAAAQLASPLTEAKPIVPVALQFNDA